MKDGAGGVKIQRDGNFPRGGEREKWRELKQQRREPPPKPQRQQKRPQGKK